ncbi:MAG: OST-HTH/LOTUS domain-containing protein [Sphingomonas bacterium]
MPRSGVEAAARDDGRALLAAADPRNYGVKNFPALFEATGLFEITRSENSQTYIADKRNKERTLRPTR